MSVFLSTLSLRRATPSNVNMRLSDWYFYPRSPCGERLIFTTRHMAVGVFLSTLSLRRATLHYRLYHRCMHRFLSTLSLRRATRNERKPTPLDRYFYPRSPCGERPSRLHKNICVWGFLSTLSLRRATSEYRSNSICRCISIHALLAESDTITGAARAWALHFYPRSPCGERR